MQKPDKKGVKISTSVWLQEIRLVCKIRRDGGIERKEKNKNEQNSF
jgi:hypothetical protein